MQHHRNHSRRSFHHARYFAVAIVFNETQHEHLRRPGIEPGQRLPQPVPNLRGRLHGIGGYRFDVTLLVVEGESSRLLAAAQQVQRGVHSRAVEIGGQVGDLRKRLLPRQAKEDGLQNIFRVTGVVMAVTP